MHGEGRGVAWRRSVFDGGGGRGRGVSPAVGGAVGRAWGGALAPQPPPGAVGARGGAGPGVVLIV